MASLKGNFLYIDNDETITVILMKELSQIRTLRKEIGKFSNGKWLKGNDKGDICHLNSSISIGIFRSIDKTINFPRYRGEGIITKWDIRPYKTWEGGEGADANVCLNITKISKQFTKNHYNDITGQTIGVATVSKKIKNIDFKENKISLRVRFLLTLDIDRVNGHYYWCATNVSPIFANDQQKGETNHD